MADARDLTLIRQALARELDTINHYQDLRDQATDPEVRVLLEHLMNEEKEHVAELTAMLRRLDAVQDRHFVQGHAPELSATAEPRSLGWTVGSLIESPLA